MNRARDNVLFAHGNLGDVLRQNIRPRVALAVDDLSKDQLLGMILLVISTRDFPLSRFKSMKIVRRRSSLRRR